MRPLRLAAPVLLLAAAGCFRRGAVLPRDAVPTVRSAGVLAAYSFESRPEPPVREGRPAKLAVPLPAGPGVQLPGRPPEPWEGSPRTLPCPEVPRERPAPPPAGRRPVAAPEGGGIRPGDSLRVTVSGHPEFSGVWGVDRQGLLEVPDGGAFGVGGFAEAFVESVGPVKGLEAGELRRRLAVAFQRYVRKPPRVQVRVLDAEEG